MASIPAKRPWDKFSVALIGVLVLVSLLFAIFVHAYIGLSTRYNADDYCFAQLARSSGFLAAQGYWYTQYRGVFSHTAAISLAGIAGPRIVSYFPSIVLALWLVGLTWSIWQFALMIGLRRPFIASLLLAEVVIFRTISATPNIVQSLFWQSGMFSYTAPLLLLVGYVGFIAYKSRKWPFRTTPYSLVLSIAFPFVAGGFSETYVAFQTGALFLAVGLALLLLRGESFRRATFRLLLGGFVGSILALAVVILAPGNAVRQANFPSPPGMLSVLVHSADYTLRFVGIRYWFHDSGWLLYVVGPAFLAYTLYPQKNLVRSTPPGRPRWPELSMLALPPILGFILIVCSFAPSVWGLSRIPPVRAQIVPEFILVCVQVLWGVVVGLTLRRRGTLDRDVSMRYSIFACVLIIVLLVLGPLASARRILSLAPQFRAYASRWDDRDGEMHDAKLKGRQNLSVPALGYTGGLEDILPDPKFWVNYCFARFYGLDSVKAERASAEDFPTWWIRKD